MVERLTKVRRLARQSPVEGERKAAESKLQELLKRHAVTEAELDAFDRRAERPGPMPAPWPARGNPFEQVVVVEGGGFGSIFAAMFGGGFSFHVSSDTGTSSTSTDGS